MSVKIYGFLFFLIFPMLVFAGTTEPGVICQGSVTLPTWSDISIPTLYKYRVTDKDAQGNYVVTTEFGGKRASSLAKGDCNKSSDVTFGETVYTKTTTGFWGGRVWNSIGVDLDICHSCAPTLRLGMANGVHNNKLGFFEKPGCEWSDLKVPFLREAFSLEGVTIVSHPEPAITKNINRHPVRVRTDADKKSIYVIYEGREERFVFNSQSCSAQFTMPLEGPKNMSQSQDSGATASP